MYCKFSMHVSWKCSRNRNVDVVFGSMITATLSDTRKRYAKEQELLFDIYVRSVDSVLTFVNISCLARVILASPRNLDNESNKITESDNRFTVFPFCDIFAPIAAVQHYKRKRPLTYFT